MRRGAVTALAVLLGLALTPAPAAATDDWAVVPDAVVESVGVGGAASTEADTLARLALPTVGAGSQPPRYSYGPPLRLLVWDPAPRLDNLTSPPVDTLTQRDVSIVVGARWLAVQYADGEPHATLEVDGSGDFVSLGSYLTADVEVLAGVQEGTVLLGASVLGDHDEFYAVSTDRRTLTALNTAAQDRIDAEQVTIAEFRRLKDRQRAAEEAASPTDLPPDAIGAVDGHDEVGTAGLIPLLAALGASLVGAALLFAGGVLTGRLLRSRVS